MKSDNPCDNAYYRLQTTFDITRGGDLMRAGEIVMRSTATSEEVLGRLVELGEGGMTYDDALFQATIEFCTGERAK